MNTRERVLKEALNCVNGEREKQYGNPEDNFKRIAELWSVYLTSIFEDVIFELDPIDVAKMMVLFKIARANGPKDKLDNYVDIIGYAACAAEIFEGQSSDSDVIGHANIVSERTYSYYHHKLREYVYDKAKEEHILLNGLASLKRINKEFPREVSQLLDEAATDCASEGKYGGLRLLDYYKEIDELFAKYKPDIAKNLNEDAYKNISTYITSSSKKADVDMFDVVDYLTRNGHAPTEMADLLMCYELGFDDVAAYIDDAINEIKKEGKK